MIKRISKEIILWLCFIVCLDIGDV